jgi:drug/metabolite transporter (DMT)-like permease
MDFFGPFGFNGLRFILGSLFLFPVVLVREGLRGPRAAEGRGSPGAEEGRNFFRASLLTGALLFIASSLQTVGIIFTSTGNSGLITGLYVVLVPIMGIFLGRRTGVPTWIGAGLTFTGLFFLSAAGAAGGRVNPGDIMTMVSAFFWSLHVLLIDRLVKKIDPVKLSQAQFAWCGAFSLLAVLILREPISPENIRGGLVPLLYGGLASVGIANTLQAVAQRHAPPAHAVIILCLEGFFAALAGALIFHEIPGIRALLGAVLMLCGMLVTQWELIRGKGMGPPRHAPWKNREAVQERS